MSIYLDFLSPPNEFKFYFFSSGLVSSIFWTEISVSISELFLLKANRNHKINNYLTLLKVIRLSIVEQPEGTGSKTFYENVKTRNILERPSWLTSKSFEQKE